MLVPVLIVLLRAARGYLCHGGEQRHLLSAHGRLTSAPYALLVPHQKTRTVSERHDTGTGAETDRVAEAVYDNSATVNEYSPIEAAHIAE